MTFMKTGGVLRLDKGENLEETQCPICGGALEKEFMWAVRCDVGNFLFWVAVSLLIMLVIDIKVFFRLEVITGLKLFNNMHVEMLTALLIGMVIGYWLTYVSVQLNYIWEGRVRGMTCCECGHSYLIQEEGTDPEEICSLEEAPIEKGENV